MSTRRRRTMSRSPSPSRHGVDYKAECEYMERMLQRRKRDIEECEYHTDVERGILRKAKQDNEDLWKIYDTLQKELSAAYDRNAKLTQEKKKVQVDVAKADVATFGGAGNVDQFRVALDNLRKEKADIEHKYDRIAAENAAMATRNDGYRQKLDELDALKASVAGVVHEMHTVGTSVTSIEHGMTMARFHGEATERFRKWNGSLCVESEAKQRRLNAMLPLTQCDGEQWLRASQVKAQWRRAQIVDRERRLRRQMDVVGLLRTVKDIRVLWSTTAQCIKEELAAIQCAIVDARGAVDQAAAQIRERAEGEGAGAGERPGASADDNVVAVLRSAVRNIDTVTGATDGGEVDNANVRRTLDVTLAAVQTVLAALKSRLEANISLASE